MPVHLNGVLVGGGFRAGGGDAAAGYRSAVAAGHHPPGLSPGLMQRTASLEMLNNIKFEEKRALIASTLSLNDLLKPSQDYRAVQQKQHAGNMVMSPPVSHAQFSAAGGAGGYMLPSSLYKPNSAVSAYNNINFLNNGIAEKDLGKIGK
jgi:hypothetical protein